MKGFFQCSKADLGVVLDHAVGLHRSHSRRLYVEYGLRLEALPDEAPRGAWRIWIMAGHFELFTDHQSAVRFRLLAADGSVLAVSGPFDDKKAVAAAIFDVRECAGMGLIEDHRIAAAHSYNFAAPQRPSHPRNQLRRIAAKRRAKAVLRQDPEGLDAIPLESEHVGDVLSDLASQAVTALSITCRGVSYGLSLARPKRTPAFGGSGSSALWLNHMQDRLGQGPGVTAGTEQATVLVRDLTDDERWPLLARSAANQGIRSVLAVPFPAEGNAATILTLCIDRPDAFDHDDILAAEKFAGQASRILRPALRIAELKDTVENLHAALANRTVIDTAVGVVMAQNHCNHDAAFAILGRAASVRNVKVRDVAAAIVASVSKEHLPVHFEP